MAEALTYKLIPEITPEVYQRFWSKATLTANPDKCWVWNGWIRDNKKPYGKFEINRERFSAPRLAYFIYFKIDPKELHVLHKCDNPKCVNPNHLFLGTNQDNVDDKMSKGREAKGGGWKKEEKSILHGSKNPCAKLTEQDVVEIRKIYIPNVFGAQRIANIYGVSKRAIQFIVNNHHWKRV